MRISDWSSDVCSSDLADHLERLPPAGVRREAVVEQVGDADAAGEPVVALVPSVGVGADPVLAAADGHQPLAGPDLVLHGQADMAGLQIGRAPVGTPVTNEYLACRLLLEKKNKQTQ